MYTLMAPKDAEHSWLTVALGFLFASARRSLLEAQYLWGDRRAQWRNCAPRDPSPPQAHPTHSGHRGGTAGSWRDGSSAHCRNFHGICHKLCPGCGCIRLRRMCLEGHRAIGVSGDPGFHPHLCCLLCDPGPVPLSACI